MWCFGSLGSVYWELCCTPRLGSECRKCCGHNRLETINSTQLCLTQHLEILLAESRRKEWEIIIQQIPPITAQLSVLVVNGSPQQWVSEQRWGLILAPCWALLNATDTFLRVGPLYWQKWNFSVISQVQVSYWINKPHETPIIKLNALHSTSCSWTGCQFKLII